MLDPKVKEELKKKYNISDEVFEQADIRSKEMIVILGDMIKEIDRVILNAEKQASNLKHPSIAAKGIILDRIKRNIYQREFYNDVQLKALTLDAIAGEVKL